MLVFLVGLSLCSSRYHPIHNPGNQDGWDHSLIGLDFLAFTHNTLHWEPQVKELSDTWNLSDNYCFPCQNQTATEEKKDEKTVDAEDFLYMRVM